MNVRPSFAQALQRVSERTPPSAPHPHRQPNDTPSAVLCLWVHESPPTALISTAAPDTSSAHTQNDWLAWGEGWSILLTKRQATLPHHAGQVAFPGGVIDKITQDASEQAFESILACAMREAREEVNLPEHAYQVLGYGETYRVKTGFLIHPVIALAPETIAAYLLPNHDEVAQIFYVPWRYLANPQHWRREIYRVGEERYEWWALDYEEKKIWGASASILHTTITKIAELIGLSWPIHTQINVSAP